MESRRSSSASGDGAAEAQLPGAFLVGETGETHVEDAAPIAPRAASVLLAEAGISRCPFEIGGLLSAADITDVQHSLRVWDGMIVLWGRPSLVPEPAMVTT